MKMTEVLSSPREVRFRSDDRSVKRARLRETPDSSRKQFYGPRMAGVRSRNSLSVVATRTCFS